MSTTCQINLGKDHAAKEHEEFPTGVSVSEEHDSGNGDKSVLSSESSSGYEGEEKVQRASKLYRDSPKMLVIILISC